MSVVSIRLDREVLEKIEEIARKKGIDRSAVIKSFIVEGLRRERLKEALELLRKGELTLEQAAEYAGITIYELHWEMKNADIPIGLRRDTLYQEIEYLKKKISRNKRVEK